MWRTHGVSRGRALDAVGTGCRGVGLVMQIVTRAGRGLRCALLQWAFSHGEIHKKRVGAFWMCRGDRDCTIPVWRSSRKRIWTWAWTWDMQLVGLVLGIGGAKLSCHDYLHRSCLKICCVWMICLLAYTAGLSSASTHCVHAFTLPVCAHAMRGEAVLCMARRITALYRRAVTGHGWVDVDCEPHNRFFDLRDWVSSEVKVRVGNMSYFCLA